MGADEHGDRPPDLTAEECVRSGMYWFGQGDFTAAEAWWRCALQIEPSHTRAAECLRLLSSAQVEPSPGEAVPLREEAGDIFSVVGSNAPSNGAPPHLETGSAREMREVSQFLDQLAGETSGAPDVSDLSDLLDSIPVVPPQAVDSTDLSDLLEVDDLGDAAGAVTEATGPNDPPVLDEPLSPGKVEAPVVSSFAVSRPASMRGELTELPAYLASPRERPLDPKVALASPSGLLQGGMPDELRFDSGAQKTGLDGPGALRGVEGTDVPFGEAVWAGKSSAHAATDPLEFASEIPEDTGDVIRMDDITLTGGVSPTPWDDGPARTAPLTLAHDDEHDAIADLGDEAVFPAPGGDDVIGMFVEGDDQSAFDYGPTASPAPEPAREPEPEIQLDEPVEMQPIAEAEPDSPEALLQEARDRYQLHDFAGAIELVERLEELSPGHAEGRALFLQSTAHLTRMLESKLGKLDRIPRLLISNEEVIWLNLNHRAGFVLAQIDGSLSYDDVIMLSGMQRLDALRILVELVQNRVIGAD